MNAVEKKLADLIREHPNLYDPSRRDYKNTLKGQLSWREIAESMGKPEGEVKLKWKNLRDKFCKAKKRMAKRSFSPPADDENSAAEKLVPVLYGQMAWLGAFVKSRPLSGTGDNDEGAGSADELQKQRHKGKTHSPIPVVSTSFSVQDPCPSSHPEMGVSQKRKRQSTADSETSSADVLSSIRDEDELFLLSLLPSLKRLNTKKRMEVRMKFQQVLYAAEFEE